MRGAMARTGVACKTRHGAIEVAAESTLLSRTGAVDAAVGRTLGPAGARKTVLRGREKGTGFVARVSGKTAVCRARSARAARSASRSCVPVKTAQKRLV